MHNPFIPLSDKILEALMQEPMLFVREAYPRGNASYGNHEHTCLLLTYYDKRNDLERNRALFHVQQLKHDRMVFLYDSENEEHRSRLYKAAMQPPPFKVYINILETEWRPETSLRNQIHAYVSNHLKRDNNHQIKKLHIQLKDRYGKLFLVLTWKGNRTEVLLDTIETT